VFSLYDADTAGTQVGSTISLGKVPVAEGLFTVQLDFGDYFDGKPLWLEIGVAAGGSGGPYSTLSPRQPLAPAPYAIFAGRASTAPWGGLTGVPGGFADGVDNGSAYKNVVIVAKSGGDFTNIQSALDSITTAGDANRFLVYVAPGVYTEQVSMKPFVDIQGSGELTTKITYTGSVAPDTGTLIGANDAELRFLTVENTGGSNHAIAIYNSGSAPRLTHITASASGGTSANYGVFNVASSPKMTDMTASATGGAASYGVYSTTISSPTMTNMTASASGATNNVGVGSFNNSTLTMTNVTASASGGTISYGLDSNGSSWAVVNNSKIAGVTATVLSYASSPVSIGASQLSGGLAAGISGGTVICAGVYDENYTFYASTCP
jgi:pectin methylesterase-like acyl-CoA thioesterase